MAAEKELSKLLKIEEIGIPSNGVYIGSGYLQHSGGGWKGYRAL